MYYQVLKKCTNITNAGEKSETEQVAVDQVIVEKFNTLSKALIFRNI